MVIDVHSRKVVGWAFGERMPAGLVILALNMALMTRKPQSVIHHSDQGSQYTSIVFGNRCKEMGVRPCMGTVTLLNCPFNQPFGSKQDSVWSL